MHVARWYVQTNFGETYAVLDQLKAYCDTMSKSLGIDPGRIRIMTGCVGAYQSSIALELQVESLEEFGRIMGAKGLGASDIKPMNEDFSKKVGSSMSPNSGYWEIYRIEEFD